MFTLTGKIAGRDIDITWDNGTIEPEFIAPVIREEDREWVRLDPWAAYDALAHLFDEPPTYEGDELYDWEAGMEENEKPSREKSLLPYLTKATCEIGQRSDLTGCTPASGEQGTGPTKPKASLSVPKVKPSPFAKMDKFGSRPGTKVGLINEALINGATTVEAIAKASGQTVSDVKGHLRVLLSKGHIKKTDAGFELVEKEQEKGPIEKLEEPKQEAQAKVEEKKPGTKPEPNQEPQNKENRIGQPCKEGETAKQTGCMPERPVPVIPKDSPYKATKTDDELFDIGLAQNFRYAAVSYASESEKPEHLKLSVGDQLQLFNLYLQDKVPQLYVNDSPMKIRDALKEEGVDINKLSDAELLKILKSPRFAANKDDQIPDKWYSSGFRKPDEIPSYRISASQMLENATGEEKEKALPYLAGLLTKYRDHKYSGYLLGVNEDGLTDEENLLWADSLEEASGGEKLKTKYDEEDKKEDIDYNDHLSMARLHTWRFSKNYEVFVNGFAGNWAATGGGTAAQQILSSVTKEAAPQNEGKSFWTIPEKKDEYGRPFYRNPEPKFDRDRMTSHFKQMYQKTQEFYKKKLDKELTIYRGVGGEIESYLPAAVESWTTDKNTPKRFGKQMAKPVDSGRYRYRPEAYTVLQATVKYSDILFSYETMKEVPNWPVEKRLKGKKEFVPFGGALQNLTARVEYVDRPSR